MLGESAGHSPSRNTDGGFSSAWGESDGERTAEERMLFDDSLRTEDDETATPPRPSMPQGGVVLEVSGLTYMIDVPDGRNTRQKVLLQDVSFRCLPGRLVGILGASGAGKSTTLDLVAGRKLEGRMAGSILFNGHMRGPALLRDTAYIQQDVLLFPELTVRESVNYAARLRMPRGTPAAARAARVNGVLKMLHLSGCAQSPVGDALRRGISGGQRRRLSIAMEVVALPSLICLDEISTGLDSATALSVFASVHALVRPGPGAGCGRTALATVHQPGPALFASFDEVALLHGGRLLFFGPPAAAESYFLRLGFVRPRGKDVADFIIAVAAGAEEVCAPKEAGGTELGANVAVAAIENGGGAGGGGGSSGDGGGSGGHGGGACSGNGGAKDRSTAELAAAFQQSGLFTRMMGTGEANGSLLSAGSPGSTDSAELGLFVPVVSLLTPPYGGSSRRRTPAGRSDEEEAEVEVSGFRCCSCWDWLRSVSSSRRRRRYYALNRGDDSGGAVSTGGTKEALTVWASLPSGSMQFCTLLSRAWLLQWRATDARLADLLKNCMVGVMAATVFYKQGRLDPHEALIDPLTGEPNSAASNALSLLYFGVMYGATGHMNAIPLMFFGKEIFERERAAGLYGRGPHWLAQAVAPLTPLILAYTFFVNIAYFATGWPAEWDSYSFFFIANFVGVLIGFSAAQAFAAVTPSPEVAFSIWPIFFIFFSNFAGYGVRLTTVASFWRWLCDVSFCRWLFQMLVVNAVEGFDEEDALLEMYGFDGLGKWASLGLAVLWYGIANLVTLLALRPPSNRLMLVTADEIAEAEEKEPSPTHITVAGGGAAVAASATAANGEAAADGVACSLKLVHKDGHERLLEAPDGTLYLEDDSPTTPLLSLPAAGTAAVGRWGFEVAAAGPNGKEVLGINEATTSHRISSPAVHAKGCTILFKDVCYELSAQKDRPRMTTLDSVSGKADPGRIFAILGPSGAGKSSLLDILAGRKDATGGSVLFDGQPLGPDTARRTAYVMQDDVHIESLTVRATVEFAAALRMPGIGRAANQARAKRVDHLIQILGLSDVQGSRVGGATIRGISGGEVRRLSIATAIAGLPDVIFFDEPTSGLDSSTALEVMTACRTLADEGRTIICSVHQPSPAAFQLFDDLLLLAKGRGVYFGPASGVADHIASLPFLPPALAADAAKPAADFIMEVANAAGDDDDSDGAAGSSGGGAVQGVDDGEEDEDGGGFGGNGGGSGRTGAGGPASAFTVSQLEEAFRSTSLWREFDASATAAVAGSGEEGSGPRRMPAGVRCGKFGGRQCPTPAWWQTFVLTKRHFLGIWSNTRERAASLGQHLFVGLFYGLLWYQLPPERLYERLSLLFFSLVFIMLGQQTTVPGIFRNRLMFYRERGAGVVSTGAYWLSVSVAGIPELFVNSFVYSVIVYFMAGLFQGGPTGECFGYFALIMALSNLTAQAFCQLLSVSTRSQQTAVALFPISLFFFIIFSSFLVRIPTLPDYLAWAPKLSFSRWAFEGLVVNEFEGNDALFPPPPGSGLTPSDIYHILLGAFGFRGGDKWRAVPILLINIASFRVLGFMALLSLDFEGR